MVPIKDQEFVVGEIVRATEDIGFEGNEIVKRDTSGIIRREKRTKDGKVGVEFDGHNGCIWFMVNPCLLARVCITPFHSP